MSSKRTDARRRAELKYKKKVAQEVLKHMKERVYEEDTIVMCTRCLFYGR